ncbi:beta-N-acetylhexosaminidase [Rhizobium sp. L1K21]|uniref:beta-N-acetylhexosaminidase n=1 Tax=Rhizobium sp. L1K21 TaxID=2954933 RepID=UPI002092FC36|nr:beta-N-acetylhexosaminidase [Rhizobium sp. L1K21]MCO6186156.1 beta-N-acetylhexosaminidase [Rhizobium sp. L1K21]
MSESSAVIFGCKGLTTSSEEAALYRDVRPWGFILFGRNIETLGQVRQLVDELRSTVGYHAPVLIDQEGGRVQRIKPPLTRKYPSGADLGAVYQADRDKGLRAAWLMSRLHAFDLLKLGINVNCLPVLDVPVEGSHDVIGNRAYGHDPLTVFEMGQAAADGLKAGGVLPVVKHMPGHGRGFADSHHDLPVVDAPIDVLKAHDFEPFRRMNGELMAMSAHVVYTALDTSAPATTSKTVIDDILRGYIGFDGLLMSDDVSMNALAGSIGERAANIIAAGCDMVLHCNGLMEEMKAVAANVPALSGSALERARRVMSGFPAADGLVEAEMALEFEAIMGAHGAVV